MATRRDDRAARIAASFTSDPFFDENAAPRPARAQTMGFAPQARPPQNDLMDEGDLLEEAEEYGDESTRVHASALAHEEGVLDDDDMGAGFGDEERTMIWQGHDEAPAEQWPTPSPAPIVYAAKPARATAATAAAPAPRTTRRSEPVGQPLHYGSPGVAEVAPRRTLSHQPTPGVIVAEPYAPAPSQPVQRQTIAPPVVAARQAPAPAPQPEQRGMPPLQVALIVLLAVLATAVVALAVRLGQSPEPTPTAAAPSTVVALFTTPAGASVKVDGVPHNALTPTVLTALELGRTYNISLELAGHETITTTIVPDSTAALERQFTLVPVTGTLVVNSNPAGAAITFDGTLRGPAPQTITGLDLSRTYTVSATLDGHTPATQAVRWTAGGPNEQTIELGLAPLPPEPVPAEPVAAAAEPAAAPAAAAPTRETQTTTRTERPSTTSSTSSRTSSAPATTTRTERPSSASSTSATTTARPSERPSQRPSASAGSTTSTTSSSTASGGGTISVQAVPYGQVWINNRVVASETPLLNYELPAGVHQVKVYFSGLRTFSDERSIRIEPGSSRTLTFRAPPQP